MKRLMFRAFLEDNPVTIAKRSWPLYQNNPDLAAQLPANDLWFHGTGADFSGFKVLGVKRSTNHWNNTLGIHFAANENTAQKFAKDGGRLIQARLNVHKPYDIGQERDMDKDALGRGLKAGIVTEKDIRGVMGSRKYVAAGGSWSDKTMGLEDILKYCSSYIMNSLGTKRAQIARNYKKSLEAEGYDSILYKSDYPGEHYSPCVIVFDPTHIEVAGEEK